MPLILRPQRWRQRPRVPLRVDWNNPLSAGLQVFIDLRPEYFHLNLVNGKNLAPTVNGAIWGPWGLQTTGTSYTLAYSDIGYSAAAPCSIIFSQSHFSGVVDWMLYSANWNGYYTTYSTGPLDFNIAVNVTFPGQIILPPAFKNEFGQERAAVVVAGTNDLKGISGGGAFVSDTSTTIPTGSINQLKFGSDDSNSNNAVSLIEYWGIYNRALSDYEMRELSINPWQIFKPTSRRTFLSRGAAAGGPWTITLNQVTETDLAQPFTSRKLKAFGQPSETDATQPLTRVKTRAFGQISEADTSQPFTHRKTKGFGQISEVDTPQAFTHRKTKAFGQISDTEIAQVITPIKSNGGHTVVLNQASETDTPQPIKWAPKRRVVAQASEVDTPQAFTAAKRRAIAQAAEVETTQLIRRVKSRILGEPTEVDTVQAFAKFKRQLFNQIIEVEIAQPIIRFIPTTDYSEYRLYSIAPEDRTLEIPAEDRTYAILGS